MSGAPYFTLETAGGAEAPLADPTSFGRAEDNAVVLRDASVSSHHALIRKDGAFWIVEDLGSTNGTWLNHKRVDGMAVIKEGDQIQFGSQMIRVSGFRGTVDRRAQGPARACPRCVKPLPGDAAFCPFCGIPVAEPSPSNASGVRLQPPPVSTTAPFAVPHSQGARLPQTSRWLLGCLLGGILLALISLVAGWWMWNGFLKGRAREDRANPSPTSRVALFEAGPPIPLPSL